MMRTYTKRQLLNKIAHIASLQLRSIKRKGRWTYTEIAAWSGISRARLSGIVKHELLSEANLCLLIAGGFLTVDDILKKLKGLTGEELAFIERFREDEEYAGKTVR